jgi:phosphatidylinositol glycan class A protein
MMKTTQLPLIERLRRYYGCGAWAGKLFCVLVAIDYLVFLFLEWLFPRETIDLAVNFPYEKYQHLCRLADQKNSSKEQ